MKTRFSGHDTFPLRYGWLYKATHYINNNNKLSSGSSQDIQQAMIELGVGKNMINAIRYWSNIASIVDNNDRVTSIGSKLFLSKSDSYDPYLEKIGSVWLLHWLINKNTDELTAIRWFFNYYNGQHFDKSHLLIDLEEYICKQSLKKTSVNTLEKDIECLINTYAGRKTVKGKINEDSFASPLNELNLLSHSEGNTLKSELSDQTSLPDEIFAYALLDFRDSMETIQSTFSFEQLLITPGSPARIFRLSQSTLGHRLEALKNLTAGAIDWTDTQGLRQIQFKDDIGISKDELLDAYFKAEENS